MIKCNGCGRHVRPRDPTCPFCSGSNRRGAVAYRALQFMGGAATTVVLAACYGGPDVKDSYSTDSTPPTGTGTVVGTPVGTTTLGVCGVDATLFAVTTNWVDDTLVPEDTDGDGQNDTGCDGDVLEICIQDPLGVAAWSFGMVEDGANGWAGENCLGGAGGYDICHSVAAPNDTLDEVCTPAEVVDGSTLMDALKDPFLTYYLEDAATGDCFVWGADPAYYAVLSCTEMQ